MIWFLLSLNHVYLNFYLSESNIILIHYAQLGNQKAVGKHWSHTAEFCKKQSELKSNISDETRKKYSEAQTGIKNHNYGKHKSDETKKKNSESGKLGWVTRRLKYGICQN